MKKIQKLFHPAIALMNRLKYPQKFSLICSIFIIPLSLLMYLLLTEINNGKDFVDKELLGTAYFKHLNQLWVNIPRIQLLTNSSSNTKEQEIKQIKFEIDSNFRNLETLVRERGAIVESRDQYLLPIIEKTWRELQDNKDIMSLETKNQKYDYIINKFEKLRSEIHNHSNLILDSQIDSYYLIDSLLVKVPKIQILLADIKLLAQKISHNKRATLEERTQLIIKLGFLEDCIEDLTESMQLAFEHNYTTNINTKLKVTLISFQKDIKQLTDLIEILILQDEITNIDVIFANAEQALNKSVKLFNQGIPELKILLQNRSNHLVKKEKFVYILILIILIIVVYLLIGFYLGVMQTVERLSTASDLMIQGDLTEAISLDNRDELAEVVKSFNNIGIALVQSSNKVTHLNEQLKSENIRMKAELDLTRAIQQMILPKEYELAEIPDLDISGLMQPVSEVGGDYYDVIYHNGKVKIGIGDVTGHGLESGVLMIMVQTAVRTLLENNETNPKNFLNTLNRTIYKNLKRMKSDKNLTLSLLDYQDGKLRICGQHEEMIVVRQGNLVERIDTMDLGFPIGLEANIADFIAYTDVQLNLGDVVVLYTDGATEAEDIHRAQYGLERLTKIVKQNWQLSAKEIKRALLFDVRLHIGEQEVFDDITLVVLKQKRELISSPSEYQ
jgi:serine phosphatase RsbU (regulator of sigma subunit)